MFDNNSLKWAAARVTVGVIAAALWPVAHSDGAARSAAVGALFALGCAALRLVVEDVRRRVSS